MYIIHCIVHRSHVIPERYNLERNNTRCDIMPLKYRWSLFADTILMNTFYATTSVSFIHVQLLVPASQAINNSILIFNDLTWKIFCSFCSCQSSLAFSDSSYSELGSLSCSPLLPRHLCSHPCHSTNRNYICDMLVISMALKMYRKSSSFEPVNVQAISCR